MCILLIKIMNISVHVPASQFMRKTILKELHVYVAKADNICAGHDSLAMHKKVVQACYVDYSVIRESLKL